MPMQAAIDEGFRKLYRVLVVLGVVLLVAIVASFWFGQRASCIRSNEVRAAVRAAHGSGERSKLKLLDCSQVLPEE